MVGRYAEVGKDCIHLFDVVIAQEIVQVAEIAAYKDKMGVIDNVPFGILVLVESQESSALAEP